MSFRDGVLEMRVSDRLGPTDNSPARCRLKQSAVTAACLAAQIFILWVCPGLMGFAFDSRGLISEAAAATSKPACPARDFHSFVAAFAESAALQKQYTRIPLVYGLLDMNLVGTDKEDDAFGTRLINSFEAIPFVDRNDGGRIFPSKKKRKKKGFVFDFKSPPDSSYFGKDTVVHLTFSDGGFWLAFIFVRIDDCWTLIEIDDRST